MIAPTVQVDAAEFNDAVRQYILRLGKDVPESIRKQSRLLFKYIIDRTPPKTRAEGRRRVLSEITRAVAPLDSANFRDPKIRRLIAAGNAEALDGILPSRVERFTPDLHQRARDSRGRVRKDQGISTPDAKEHRAYVRRVQANVGRARGGWAKAYAASGGKPAAWISRWDAMGEVDDRLRDPLQTYIEGRNQSEWAEHGDDSRIVATAMASRTSAILTDIEQALKRATAAK